MHLSRRCVACEVVRELHVSGECYDCLRAAGLKECSKCGELKLVTLQFEDKQSACRDCRHPTRHLNTEERARHAVYTRMYSLSFDDYRKMENEQGGVCAICRQMPTRLSVDHDHENLLVRGLLCGRCNTGIGMFMDSPALLRAAADYLERAIARRPGVLPDPAPGPTPSAPPAS